MYVYTRIFERKRNEVTGGRRKLHFEELHNFVLFTKYEGESNEDLKSAKKKKSRTYCVQLYRTYLQYTSCEKKNVKVFI
jgi:hypothetical protein